MFFAILLVVCIGAATVLQGALNRVITSQHDLAFAALLNSAVYVGGTLALFLFSRKFGEFLPDFLRLRGEIGSFSWWYLVPGFFGLIIVVGMPVAIIKIGAFHMFMIIIAIQLAGSMLWDGFVEKIPPTPLRILGASLAFIGVLLASIRKV